MTPDFLFGAIADDDTGASDLAGMLAEQGLRTLVVINLPPIEDLAEWSRGYDAIVLAEGTRNLSAADAVRRTQGALQLFNEHRPRILQIKYCSTFDSTVEGNIGQTIEAAMQALDVDFTIALPALPVNGRTTYLGHHFVHHQLLSDSPMRSHPLTPMTNPNLVGLLSCQTKLKVGLAGYTDVAAGHERLKRRFDELRNQEVGIAVVDCLDDVHLETICRAASDLRLITGSSAFGIKMPSIWRERGWVIEKAEAFERGVNSRSQWGCLIVAGSCSIATQRQNAWLEKEGVPVEPIDVRLLLDQEFDRQTLLQRVCKRLAEGQHCLLASTAIATEVQAVQQWATEKGLTVRSLGQMISKALSDLVLEILETQPASGLIIAGGETSGALCRRLELAALHVGHNIEPGVPLCFSRGRFQLPVVLKSGNFGSDDFYGKVLKAISSN
jgi:uncharacterized protein YgbK (DUF1537 family)